MSDVQEIGWAAFASTALESIEIPASVETIGENAFSSCKNLKSINVDSNNEYYSSEDGVLFNYDKSKLVQYPIGNDRTEYEIPDSVINIKSSSFRECQKIKNLTISNSVKCIESYAFSGCINMGDIIIPESVSKIEDYAFNACWYFHGGTITFKKTSGFNYSKLMLYNDFYVEVFIPSDGSVNYTNDDETIIFKHVSNDKVSFYDE